MMANCMRWGIECTFPKDKTKVIIEKVSLMELDTIENVS